MVTQISNEKELGGRLKTLALISIFNFILIGAFARAWTDQSTYTIETGDQLNYVIAAPEDPRSAQAKWPILIYEQGDGTTDLILHNTFVPSQFASQMDQASVASGFIWAVPELRTQYFVGQALQICSLDFLHRERDLQAFIDQVKQLPFVDSTRVFLMGHSAGGDTVTHVTERRSDIRGTINLAGGVSSCSEESADCPAGLPILLQYQCSEHQDMSRIGAWWRQLFLESKLFETISSMRRPYLALIGDQDTVESVSEFQIYSSRISQARTGFEFAVLPGLDHETIVTAPQAFQRMVQFVKSNL